MALSFKRQTLWICALVFISLNACFILIGEKALVYFAMTGIFILFTLLVFIHLEAGILCFIMIRSSLDVLKPYFEFPLGPFVFMNPAGIATLIILGGGLSYIVVNKVNILEFPASRPYFVFLAISLLTLLLTPDRLVGISDWMRLVSIFVIYISILNLFETEEKIHKLLQATLISVIVPSAVGFYQFLTDTGNQSVYGFSRIFATFTHPNPYAFYLTMLLPMGIVLLLKDGFSSRSIILGILCATMGISLILTYTRVAWIAVFLAIVLLGTFRYRKLLLISVPLFFLLVKFDPFLVRRLGDVFEFSSYYNPQNSFVWRIKYWSEVIPLILSRPILGYGLSSFSFYSRRWAAHNDYLRVAFETGFIGLGAYLWILLSLLMRATYVYKRMGMQYFKSLTLGFISIFIAYMTIMLSDNLMRSLVVQWYFWIFAGITFSLYKVDTERAQKEYRTDVLRDMHMGKWHNAG